MAAEKFIFKNFVNITKMECFTNLNDGELRELIEAAIKSQYCSTNDILSSLHRWLMTPGRLNTQSDDGRTNTFLTLVKKLPRSEFDEKIFAEIFLDDHRLRDNPMCRTFRDEYLSELFKIHSECKNSGARSSSGTRRTPERRMKHRVDDVELEKARKRICIADEQQNPLIETTSGQKSDGIASNVTTSTNVQILEKSPPTPSTSAQQPPPLSTSVQQAAVANGKKRKTPSVERGKSTKIISGSDGSECIGYFTSKENDSWFIGSFNLATGDVEKITNLPSFRDDGALIHAFNYLYFIGGRIVRDASSGLECSDGQEVKGQVSRRIDIFDMTEREWITENLPQLNEAREDFQRCVSYWYTEDWDGSIYRDGHIYIIGGCRTDGSDIDSVEHIPLYGLSKQKLPPQSKDFYEDLTPLQDVDFFSLQGDIYNASSGEWTEIAKMPVPRTGHSTTVYKSKFYVFGGVRKGMYSYKLASACVYDPETNAWTMLPNMHRKRHLAGAMRHNDYIYIVGGDGDDCKDSSLTIERFNPATNQFKLIENWLDKVPTDVNFYVMTKRIE